MADPKFTVRPFEKALHDRRAFSSGVEAMDRWLRESVGEQIRYNRVRVWCATDANGSFVGYYALAMHAVAPNEAPSLARKREQHPIPSIYLVALAVNTEHQGNGIGGALLGHAIQKCIQLSDEIGCAAIVLDVLKDNDYEKRHKFYVDLGFSEIGNGDPCRLYLAINDAKASMNPAG